MLCYVVTDTLLFCDNRLFNVYCAGEIRQSGRLDWPSCASRKNRQTSQRKGMDELAEMETNIPPGVWDGEPTAE